MPFKLTIGRKLALGFGTITALIACSSAVILYESQTVADRQEHVFQHDVPNAKVSLKLKQQISAAMSMHRGYMILGLPELADARKDTWANIDTMVAQLEADAARWDDPQLLEDFEAFKAAMAEFRRAQNRIADISHTPENTPATQLFVDKAVPLGDQMISALDEILDLEQQIDNPDPARKTLVRKASNARTHLVSARESIAKHLVVGSLETRAGIDQEVAACDNSVTRLKTITQLFTPKQAETFDRYLAVRESFLATAMEVIAIRDRPDWNIAEHICLHEVTPASTEATRLLTRMTDTMEHRFVENGTRLDAATSLLFNTALYAGSAVVILAIVIALLITRSTVKPLRSVIQRLDDIANGDGDLTQTVDDTRHDELGELGSKFNTFVTQIREVIDNVQQAAHEVAGAATELAATSEEMAQSADEQTNRMNSVSTAMVEMDQAVQDVARKTAEASNNADRSGKTAREGGEVVRDTVSGMDGIKSAVGE
ncbi:MAG: methyl-accepting chemotaxis protein, partial [Planctomycetota bacterium]